MIEDLTHGAARVSVRPDEALTAISIGAASGALTVVAGSAPVFSFRNIGANPITVRKIGIGFITTTAFTAAQTVDFGLVVARSFSASDSGGNAITLTGNNCKRRTSLAALTNVDCRIAATAALTPGTRTLDANAIVKIGGWSGGVGQTISPALDNLYSRLGCDYPLTLATNEGFLIVTLTAMGAAGVGTLYVNLDLNESIAY